MSWITTKTGAHINTDWFDKERQIEQNREQANQRNTVKGSTVIKKNGLRSSRELIPKNSYTNNPEIQQAEKWLSDTWDERQSAGSKWVEAYRELEKAEMKYLDPELVQALGKREAMMFVNDEDHPDTAELRQKWTDFTNVKRNFKKKRKLDRTYCDVTMNRIPKNKERNMADLNLRKRPENILDLRQGSPQHLILMIS